MRHPGVSSETRRYGYPAYERFLRCRRTAGYRNRGATAVNAVPRVVAIKDAPEGEDDIISVKGAGRFKPVGSLELDLIAQVEAVGGAVIKRFPSFPPVQAPDDRYKGRRRAGDRRAGRQGVDNQAAADFLRVKGIYLPADAMDKPAIADIGISR